MRALVLTHHQSFDGLVLSELAAPQPGAGQVSIDVEYAGVGLIDALWVTGAMPSGPGFVPGLEVSGTVRSLGEGVGNFDVGQQVAAILPAAGGFADVACAPAALVSPIPAGLRVDLAAVVSVNTVTAHLALTTVARFSAGWVLNSRRLHEHLARAAWTPLLVRPPNKTSPASLDTITAICAVNWNQFHQVPTTSLLTPLGVPPLRPDSASYMEAAGWSA